MDDKLKKIYWVLLIIIAFTFALQIYTFKIKKYQWLPVIMFIAVWAISKFVKKRFST